MRTRILGAMALMAGALLTAPAGAALAQAVPPDGGVRLTTTLTGAAEVPGPGDPDGSGTATLNVNPGLRQVCWTIVVTGVEPITAAHIHLAQAITTGPVVVPLVPYTGGCTDVDRDLALAILTDPDSYYVNVHNAPHPAGAVRGQLSYGAASYGRSGLSIARELFSR